MTHTKGPWEVLFSHSGYPYQITAPNADNSRVGVVGKDITRWSAITFPSSVEGLANARLISAAPDLLEALKKCAGVCAGETFGKNGLIEALELARAAITKAEGKTQ